MKTINRFVTLTALIALFSGTIYTVSAQSNQKTVTFQTNLRCDKCRAAIEDSLPFEKGVKDIMVDVPAKTVTITYDTKRTNPETIGKALEKLGYDVHIKDNTTATPISSTTPEPIQEAVRH